jgi:hypothetical protein
MPVITRPEDYALLDCGTSLAHLPPPACFEVRPATTAALSFSSDFNPQQQSHADVQAAREAQLTWFPKCRSRARLQRVVSFRVSTARKCNPGVS